MAKKDLTEQRIRFCQEYIIDLAGSKAAIRAGYSPDPNAAKVEASRLLANEDVQEYLQELLEQRAARTMVTADKVLSELYHLATFDVAELYDDGNCVVDIKSIPKNLRKAIASIEVFEEYEGQGKNRTYIGRTKKIKFWDKTRAVEMLAKHLKLLSDTTVIVNHYTQIWNNAEKKAKDVRPDGRVHIGNQTEVPA